MAGGAGGSGGGFMERRMLTMSIRPALRGMTRRRHPKTFGGKVAVAMLGAGFLYLAYLIPSPTKAPADGVFGPPPAVTTTVVP